MIKVAFCIPGRNFTNRFLISWTNLLLSCRSFDVQPMVNFAYSNMIFRVRDLCLGAKIGESPDQKPFQGMFKYDYIMWIDSDMVFEPQQFKTLLDRMERNKKYKILSGIYYLEDGRQAIRNLPNKENKQEIEPYKVMFSGMGFMLVRYGVFEALTYPWFIPIIKKGEGGAQELSGDDFSFCERIKKEANIDIYVDPHVQVGHEKPTILR